MFTLKKFMIVATVLVSIGTITIGGGVALVRSSQAQDPKPNVVRPDNAYLLDKTYKPAGPIDVDQQIKEMLKLAHSRFEIRSALYNAGELAIDLLIDACDELQKAELYAARNFKERRAAKERQLTRFKNIEARAAALEKAGQVGTAELQGIKIRRLELELDLRTDEKEDTDLPALLKRLKELEKKVEQLEKRVPAPLGRL